MACKNDNFLYVKLLKCTKVDRKYLLLFLSLAGIISIQLIYITTPISFASVNIFESLNIEDLSFTIESYNPVKCHKCSPDNYESDALDPTNWIPKEPFVYYRAFGGLGNQLFQYACAYTIAKKNKIPLLVYADPKPDSEVPGFRLNHGDFALHLFNIPLPHYDIDKIGSIELYIENSKNRSLFHGLGDGAILSQTYPISDKILSLNDYCQSELFFRPYKEDILEFYKPKQVTRIEKWIEMIGNDETSDSVSVHVRRGDYLTTENRLVNDSYYIAAMKEVSQRLEVIGRTPKFYIFSDGIDQVKESFQQLLPAEDYDQLQWVSDTEKTLVEDLYLISQCRHNIITGSSYGWWGAYLNQYPQKIVIAAHFKPSLFDNDPFHGILYRHAYYPIEWFVKEADFVN